jgi:hypothetical protein
MEDVTLNSALSENIDKCIRILRMKFKEHPYNFFTESDAHSYLYYSFFRYGTPALKGLYKPITPPKVKTVLIHREYPTFFRYRQKDLRQCYDLNVKIGDRGHYDMVVLNPAFIESHDIKQVISKNNTICQTIKFEGNPLLAAIEFKLLHKPLGEDLIGEIKKDFIKLSWAWDRKQAQKAYMLIFNRWGEEKQFRQTLDEFQTKYPAVKLIYQEAYYDDRVNKKCLGSYPNKSSH